MAQNTPRGGALPGGKLAYVSNASGNPQIYVDGNRVSSRGAYNMAPVWCNDKESPKILFMGRDGSSWDIFSVDPSGSPGSVKRLTQDQGSNTYPACSPDGRSVAFFSTRGGLFTANALASLTWSTMLAIGALLGGLAILAIGLPIGVSGVALAPLSERGGRGDYASERRVTRGVGAVDGSGTRLWSSFAVNDVSLERGSRQKVVEILATIDGLPVSRWACDGILISTPTGSTAYAFSAGGPVMWPNVEAFLVVPLSAHALFARPLDCSQDFGLSCCLPCSAAVGLAAGVIRPVTKPVVPGWACGPWRMPSKSPMGAAPTAPCRAP